MKPAVHQRELRFEGPREERDEERIKRLTGQLMDVFHVMVDGKHRTLEQISNMTGHPEASVSAQLRHLRKFRFGSYIVKKKHRGGGLYEYWLPLDDRGMPERNE